METMISLLCLAGFVAFGFCLGYATCLIRVRGRPRLHWPDEAENA